MCLRDAMERTPPSGIRYEEFSARSGSRESTGHNVLTKTFRPCRHCSHLTFDAVRLLEAFGPK